MGSTLRSSYWISCLNGRVTFGIDHQSFSIDSIDGPTSKFIADMLCVAMDRLAKHGGRRVNGRPRSIVKQIGVDLHKKVASQNRLEHNDSHEKTFTESNRNTVGR